MMFNRFYSNRSACSSALTSVSSYGKRSTTFNCEGLREGQGNGLGRKHLSTNRNQLVSRLLTPSITSTFSGSNKNGDLSHCVYGSSRFRGSRYRKLPSTSRCGFSIEENRRNRALMQFRAFSTSLRYPEELNTIPGWEESVREAQEQYKRFYGENPRGLRGKSSMMPLKVPQLTQEGVPVIKLRRGGYGPWLREVTVRRESIPISMKKLTRLCKLVQYLPVDDALLQLRYVNYFLYMLLFLTFFFFTDMHGSYDQPIL